MYVSMEKREIQIAIVVVFISMFVLYSCTPYIYLSVTSFVRKRKTLADIERRQKEQRTMKNGDGEEERKEEREEEVRSIPKSNMSFRLPKPNNISIKNERQKKERSFQKSLQTKSDSNAVHESKSDQSSPNPKFSLKKNRDVIGEMRALRAAQDIDYHLSETLDREKLAMLENEAIDRDYALRFQHRKKILASKIEALSSNLHHQSSQECDITLTFRFSNEEKIVRRRYKLSESLSHVLDFVESCDICPVFIILQLNLSFPKRIIMRKYSKPSLIGSFIDTFEDFFMDQEYLLKEDNVDNPPRHCLLSDLKLSDVGILSDHTIWIHTQLKNQILPRK